MTKSRSRTGFWPEQAAGLSRSELEDHAAAFLAEIIQSLVIVEEARGKASGMMRDGSVLRKVVSERHGAQRKGLGWTEGELRREFDIVRSTVFYIEARCTSQ